MPARTEYLGKSGASSPARQVAPTRARSPAPGPAQYSQVRPVAPSGLMDRSKTGSTLGTTVGRRRLSTELLAWMEAGRRFLRRIPEGFEGISEASAVWC